MRAGGCLSQEERKSRTRRSPNTTLASLQTHGKCTDVHFNRFGGKLESGECDVG